MAHFVNMGELDELGNSIQTYAENEIRGEIDRLLSLENKYVWVGKAKEAYFNKYRELITKLYSYSDMIEKFGYFLRYVSEDYSNTRDKSNAMLKNYIDEQSGGKKSYLWERG